MKNKKWQRIIGFSIPLIVAVLASIFGWGTELQEQASNWLTGLVVLIGSAITFIGVVKSHDKPEDVPSSFPNKKK